AGGTDRLRVPRRHGAAARPRGAFHPHGHVRQSSRVLPEEPQAGVEVRHQWRGAARLVSGCRRSGCLQYGDEPDPQPQPVHREGVAMDPRLEHAIDVSRRVFLKRTGVSLGTMALAELLDADLFAQTALPDARATGGLTGL